jgi:hypothetical protein
VLIIVELICAKCAHSSATNAGVSAAAAYGMHPIAASGAASAAAYGMHPIATSNTAVDGEAAKSTHANASGRPSSSAG